MNGDISVESEINVGSVFTITLPGLIRKGKGEKESATTKTYMYSEKKSRTPMHTFDSQDILCIEDNMINSELVSLFLQKYFKVDHAHNFEQAISKAGEKKYAAVLVDINLGEGPSGIDVAKSLKSMNQYKGIPLIALTGYALLRDEKKLLSQGFDHYLAKPFDKEDLLNIISKALKK
jgi:CheY-like chemotaxis protein